MVLLVFLPDFLNFLVNVSLPLSLPVLDALQRIAVIIIFSNVPSSVVISALVQIVPVNSHGSNSLASELTSLSYRRLGIALSFSQLKIAFRVLLDRSCILALVVLVFLDDSLNLTIGRVFLRRTRGKRIISVHISLGRR